MMKKTQRSEDWELLAPIKEFVSAHPDTTVEKIRDHLNSLFDPEVSLSVINHNLNVLEKAKDLKRVRGTGRILSWEYSQVQPRLRNLDPTELKSWPAPEGGRKIESRDGAAYRDVITSQAQVNILDQVKPGDEPIADGTVLGRTQILKPQPARTRLVKKAE